MIKRRPLASFYLLAFTISWLGWIPQTLQARGLISLDLAVLTWLGGAGPTLAAVIVMWSLAGRHGPARLFKPLFDWKRRWYWYLIVFIFWPLAGILSWMLINVLGGSPGLANTANLSLLLPVFFGMLLSNVWEEIGWRGFALPHFQRRFGDVTIALIMGSLWSFWHLPLLLDPSSPMSQFPWLLEILFSIAQTVIYIWLYNQTRGSLVFVSLFHAMANTVAFALLDLGLLISTYPYVVAVTSIAAAALILRYGARRLGDQAGMAGSMADQPAWIDAR